jgi:hypothetical protein
MGRRIVLLKSIVTFNVSLITPFQQVSSSNFSLARAAPENCKCCKITIHNAKRWLEWCKAHLHWTLAVRWTNLGLSGECYRLNPLVPVKGNRNAIAYNDIIDDPVLNRPVEGTLIQKKFNLLTSLRIEPVSGIKFDNIR